MAIRCERALLSWDRRSQLTPSSSRDSEDVSMRLLAQGLLESIDALGYYIITSIGMSTGGE